MKKVLLLAILASVTLSISAKKKLAITMTGENLATLTQVTDNKNHAWILLVETMVPLYISQ